MDNSDVLSSSLQPQFNEIPDVTGASVSPEKVCIMRGEASAENVDEMTSTTSTHWPANHEVKQEKGASNDCALYNWFESEALSEAVSSVDVDQMDSNPTSLHEIIETSRLTKNKDLLKLLDEIGLEGDTSIAAGQHWQVTGCSDFNSESNECYSVGSTNESQQFNDCQPPKTYFEPLPGIVPSFHGTVGNCSPGETGSGTMWTSSSAVKNERGVTLECIQTGETVPIDHFSNAVIFTSTSQEERDLSDELEKQEEKRRKRRERNKQCSREFRRKQKVREQLLGRGKVEKEQILLDRQMRVEKTTKILLKIANSSGACEKGRGIINMVAGLFNKENWSCNMAKGTVIPNVSHHTMQKF